jgi:hypothetical protein
LIAAPASKIARTIGKTLSKRDILRLNAAQIFISLVGG